jgi:outer membrane protein with beta-barrel domain
MKILRCFLVLSFLLIAVSARANDVALFGGVHHEGKLTLNNAVSNASTVTFNPRNFGVFGLRVSHGSVIGGEHTFAYAPNFIESQTKAIIYHSNLLVQIPTPKVKPYLTAGIGGVFTSGNDVRDFGNKFLIDYGGGVKVFPAGPVGVVFDVRGYTIPDIKIANLTSATLNIIQVSVGVAFAF